MQILEDLYVGDVRPSERYFQKNSQYAEALDDEVTVLTDCETFCFAFKLGAKIMMDVLTDGPMKEI